MEDSVEELGEALAMCGRYYVDDETAREIERIVNKLDERFKIRTKTDIYPSNMAPVLIGDTEPSLSLKEMKWGFPSVYNSIVINARAETITDKKMFRESIIHRRCLIPAKGFYEWNSQEEKVQFENTDHEMLLFAGIYNKFDNQDCFVIITTKANESVLGTHERMPLVITADNVDPWLSHKNNCEVTLRTTPKTLRKLQDYEQQSLL